MKKNLVLAAVALCASSAVFAGTHTITGGYASSKAEDAHLKGINVKYGFTPDESAVGVMASLTVTGSSEEYNGYGIHEKLDLGYGSLMGGVSYQINEYVKPYALIGVARGASDYEISGYGQSYSESDSDTGFAYGVGIQVTPVKGFTIDAGYEGAKVFDAQVNTWMVALGYRF